MTRIEDRSKGGLVVTRKPGERVRVRIGSVVVWVEVAEVERGKIRLRFDGPPGVEFLREELLDEPGTSPGGAK